MEFRKNFLHNRESLEVLPVAAYVCDAEGRIAGFNRLAVQFWGHEPRIGQAVADLWSVVHMFGLDGTPIYPGDVPILQALKKKTGLSNQDNIVERPDGTRFTLRFSTNLIADDAGKIMGAISIFQDISAQKKSEQVLQEAHRALLHHLSNSPLAVVEWDSHFRVSRWSEKAERLFGWKSDEVLGKTPYDWQFIHVEDVELTRKNMWELLTGTAPNNVFKVRNYNASGELVTSEWYNSALIDEAGRLVSVLSLVLDLTQKNRADEVLKSSEAQFKLLAEAIPQIVWTTNAAGVADYFNERWFEYTGNSRKSSKPSDASLAVHVEDRARVMEHWQRNIKHPQPVFEFEYRLRKRDGTYRWHLGRIVPVRGRQGRVIKWLGAATDIHDQKVMLNQLKESQQRLEVALEAGRMATWELDIATREMKRSDGHHHLFGFDRPVETWTLQTWLDCIHPDDRDNVREFCQRAVAGEFEHYTHEYRVVWTDGSTHWLSSRARLERDAQGKPARIRGAVMDISELKDAESALQKALRLRDEFLNFASHELRTPLTALKLQFQLLDRAVKKPDSFREPNLGAHREKLMRMLSLSDRQIDQLSYLLDGLLDVSRIANQRFTLELQEIDLAALLDEIIDEFQITFRESKCELRYEKSPPLVGMWDMQRMRLLFFNLLANAVKYGVGNPIEVRLEQKGEIAEFSVRDHGAGIAPENHEKVFERFEKATTTSGRLKGLGLGLFLSKHIATAHGGSIRVESRLGEGARFVLDLPLQPAVAPGMPVSLQDEGSEGAPSAENDFGAAR